MMHVHEKKNDSFYRVFEKHHITAITRNGRKIEKFFLSQIKELAILRC
jgi:hypothetical protein